MIKLTQLLYEVKDEVTRKIENLSNVYQRAIDEYETAMVKFEANPYGEEPTSPLPPKPYKLKDEDFNITEAIMYINPSSIVYISKAITGETILNINQSKELTVKESVEEVYELMAK